jgi:succinate-acetate transporter protein
MPNAGWFDRLHVHGPAMMFPLAVVLLIMGILAFTNERTLDAVIFFGGAGLFWSGHVYLRTLAASSGSVDPGYYAGWYWFVWAVFFCYVWFSSLKAGLVQLLFLLGLWLTLLALAIGDWSGLHGFIILSGYLGLATAILAAIISAVAVIRYGNSGRLKYVDGSPE